MAGYTSGKSFGTLLKAPFDSNDSLSSVDKFSYLHGLLEGPSKASIAGFAPTEANYNAVIELLLRRFPKKIAIERAHISELLKVQPLYSERDPRRLRVLCDLVEMHDRGLVATGVEEQTYSSIVVPFILKKLRHPEADLHQRRRVPRMEPGRPAGRAA